MVHTHYSPDNVHKAGHLDDPGIHEADCPTCQQVAHLRRAEIFAAARVVRDSEILQNYASGSKSPLPDGEGWRGDYTFERATLALAYVRNDHYEYASAEDFDNRYNGQWDTFGDFVQNLVDDFDMLNGVPDNLKYYFDYEKFGRDLLLGGDYTTIELPDYRVLVMSNR